MVARAFLWAQATLCLLVGIPPLFFSGRLHVRTFLLLALVVLTGLAALLAGLLWKWRPVLARRLGIAAATVTLFLFPVGTALGALQLWAFLSKAPPKPEPLPPPGPQAGTVPIETPWTIAVASVFVAGALTWLVYQAILFRWGSASPWMLLGLPPAFLFPALIHEAGHAWMTVRQGLRLELFMVGPFCWTQLSAGWRFAYLPKAMPGAGGMIFGSALEDTANLRRRIAAVLLGGVAANGVAALLALAVLFSVDGSSPILVGFLGCTIVLNGAAILNLIPHSNPAFKTDGQQALDLWRGGQAASDIEGGWLRAQPYGTKTRYRDIDTGPEVAATSSSFVGNTLIRYYQALDQGDTHLAGHWLDLAVAAEAISPVRVHDRLCATEAAWFAARNLGDASARQRLEQTFHGLPLDPFVTLRAEASILLREGRLEEAHAATREAQRLLALCPPTGWTELNSDLLDVPDPASLQALQTAVTPLPLPVPQNF